MRFQCHNDSQRYKRYFLNLNPLIYKITMKWKEITLKNNTLNNTISPKIVSIFSGCGGLDYGFHLEGWDGSELWIPNIKLPGDYAYYSGEN